MTASSLPFPVPAALPELLAAVQDYWSRLKRGDAAMPFADDVKLTELPNVADRLLLVDVFANPQRFRFNIVGRIYDTGAARLAGRFADETGLGAPLNFFCAQADATVEAAAPTYYRNTMGPSPYGRLLLPLWGDGHINMLLGCVTSG